MNMVTRWAIGAAIGLGALIGAFFYGVGVGKDKVRAEDLAALQRGLRAVQKVQGHIDQLHVAARERANIREERVREIYRQVPLVIDRPVYRTVCVDADGVQLLDRAVDAANGEGGPGAAGDAGKAAEGAAPR